MLHLLPLVSQKVLEIRGAADEKAVITDNCGHVVDAPELFRDENTLRLDASALRCWSPEDPVLYTASCGDERIRFGFSELSVHGNDRVMLNGSDYFLRGCIRGIVAHEHPNMTGGTLKDAAEKYIRQAKKYGFNLVRFHSTIPAEEFVSAADELGFFIHVEIGFAYEYDADGKSNKRLSMSNAAWTETLRRYRNHPSIAIFCIGNEMHNSGHYPEVQRLYEEGKLLAPNKLIMDNSGWGEYDRSSADIFSQHIAYYYPYGVHARMFERDDCWHLNGSAFDEDLEAKHSGIFAKAQIRREAVPRRPVLAHEAVHYIEIPDYGKLNRKFDEFAARVGQEYLLNNGIRKPKFMTALPELLRAKGLMEKYPDYIRASEEWKKMALKCYLETLRFSKLCGFEMLQFADCLKYENKNGIVDCFDDDKYIDAAWMRQFNGGSVLLAKMARTSVRSGENFNCELFLSHFTAVSEAPATLTISVVRGGEKETVYRGKNFFPVPGLQKLCGIDLKFDAPKAEIVSLEAEFTSAELKISNSWNIHVFPQSLLQIMPQLELKNSASFAELLLSRAEDGVKRDDIVVTDCFTDRIFSLLAEGKTVLALYHRDDAGNDYYFPGALERFKPCIWDRGSNLGGVYADAALRDAMGGGRYFDAAAQPLLEGAYKLNLDHFPVSMEELVFGVDKPVRDRMKGLVQGVKDFIPDDTLRNFCHTGALKAGAGKLVICTMNRHRCHDCGAAEFFIALVNRLATIDPKAEISLDALKDHLSAATAAPRQTEDVMNHFWEIDNKPVEDNLFWEESGLDLAKIH